MHYFNLQTVKSLQVFIFLVHLIIIRQFIFYTPHHERRFFALLMAK